MADYIWPLDASIPVSQPFGSNPGGYNPAGGHTGTDFAAPIGTVVRAIADGTVTYADWASKLPADYRADGSGPNPYWLAPNFGGIVVAIDHGPVVSIHAHLNETSLNVGDRVKQGQEIAKTGNTGGATSGPHLHFETLPDGWDFNNGTYGRVNPANYCSGYWSGSVAALESTVTPIPVKTATGTENWVDLSSHNGTVDFAALKASGVAGVIFKVSEGIGWEDTTAAGYNWRTAVAKARAAGLKVGFYHFARPGAQNDPKIEADWFIRCVQGVIQPDDRVVLDWEPTAAGEDPTNVAWAKQWLDSVSARLARVPWFYSYTGVLRSTDWSVVAAKYPLWHAEYWTNAEQGWGPSGAQVRTDIQWPAGVAAWQYTSKGRIPGTTGYTDLNVVYTTSTSPSTEEEIMATVHDIFVQPISDKNQKQFSQFLEDADARLQLLVDALTPGKEGVKFEGEVLKALNDLKAAVTAQAQDPSAIAKLVIDGIGTQKAEDVLIELGKLITAATTPQTPAA